MIIAYNMFIYFCLFFLGLSIGSFLNVLIDRLPKGESSLRGRSHCDRCHHKLSWYDLVPLLSFLFLKGKCRYCGKKISWQYPVVELLTGLSFIILYIFVRETYNQKIFHPTLIYFLVVISGLIVIFFTDFKYRIIPDKIILILIVTSLLYLLFFQRQLLLSHFLSGIIIMVGFFILVLLTRGRGMGGGDVKFAFFMGLFLGFPKIIVAFYLSFLTGALFSLILILTGKKTMKSTIAFGPFLVVATGISLFYGSTIWEFIKRILGI